jgi:hypothetical protein
MVSSAVAPCGTTATSTHRVAQIVITPVREGQIANRTGSDATTAQEANYLSSLRNGAVIGNVIARRAVEAQGKAPSLAPRRQARLGPQSV